jgi:hypothetical protein
MTFFEWLGQQTQRKDAVGKFAAAARKDRFFPRPLRRLCLFLIYYQHQPEMRDLVKLAHRDYRLYVKSVKLAGNC